MKYTLLYIMSGCLLLFGCRQEESFLDNAGRVRIGLGIDEEIGVVASRSALSDEESNALIENCKIRIFNDGKLVNRYGRWSEVPEDGILMPVGDKYSTLVVAGDSVPASFDSKYYKGTEDFVVAKGQTTTVNVDCNIANTLVNMVYSDELSKLLEEAKVTVSVEGGSLDFTLGESKTGYFMVPESKAELRCVFSGKTLAGKTFSYEDTIKSVKEATLYTVTYSHSEGEPVPGNYGGAFFELKVDETPLYTEEKTVKVYQRPVISAVNGSETIDFNSDMFLVRLFPLEHALKHIIAIIIVQITKNLFFIFTSLLIVKIYEDNPCFMTFLLSSIICTLSKINKKRRKNLFASFNI